MTATRELGPTYRLQLTPSFGFAEAGRVAEHLALLGVEYAYLSPIFEARPGSEHGYDVVDPGAIRSELGGRKGFEALVAAFRSVGLSLLLDIVPNHLSTYVGGPWWADVLRHGRRSPYAPVFDIDWESCEEKVILPILGSPFDEVLARGELSLGDVAGGPVLSYFDTHLPLAPDGPDPTSPLKEVLEGQHYRLQYWREPRRNYRRFFTIDDLVGVRVEDEAVFSRTHSLVLELCEAGLVDALRVDHVDGLADPEQYLERLAAVVGDRPIVIEKILTGDEPLRHRWPVAGTTGYEVADDITHALADAGGLAALATAAAADGEPATEGAVEESKRLVVETSFDSEVARLTTLLPLEKGEVRDAVVAMPVYRTYVSSRGADSLDLRLLEEAGGPRLRQLAIAPPDASTLEGLVRYQQLTSAAMAKGVEDTAWYRLVGKLPFLEVGGDPEHTPRDDEDGVARLHRRARRRAAGGERGLVPGTTHDTKRSADVRARLLALAEVASAFEGGLAAFLEAVPSRPVADGRPPVPGPLDRRRIAETCLAMAPFPSATSEEWDSVRGRVDAALRKGAREAKARDSWEEVNEAYEDALVDAATALLSDRGALLRRLFGPVLSRMQRLGATLSLSGVVLRSFLPGVPDCYQGDEAWNFSLVDPDNRRPVDYERLSQLLASLPGEGAPGAVDELRRNWPDDRLKLFVTRQCLAVRRTAPELFATGASYFPLFPDGLPSGADGSVIAFARRSVDGRAGAVVVVTRAPHRLVAAANDLPSGERSYGDGRLASESSAPHSLWREMICGDEVELRPDGSFRLADVLAHLPVAVLLPAGACQ